MVLIEIWQYLLIFVKYFFFGYNDLYTNHDAARRFEEQLH